VAGTKNKSASKRSSSKKKTAAARKTAPAKSQAVAEGAEADGTLKGAPVVAPALTPSTAPEPPKDEKLDAEQHVHTERADAMLPGAPPSVVVPSVEDLRLQDALSKQTKK